MPRIYYRKNSAEIVSEKFRDKSEIAPLNFIVLRCVWTVVFYSCVILFTKLLKDILINFPDTPESFCSKF